MPRKNFEFDEQDDESVSAQDDATDGVEVDLSTAEKDDAEETPFDDLTPRKLLENADAKDGSDDDDADERGEQDDDDQASDAPPPSSWRKRLLRAERLIEEVRDENKDLVERNKALETRVSKRETDEQLAVKRSTVNTRLVAIRTELAAAKEAGNTADEIRLNEEMVDLKADLKAAETLATQAKAADTEASPVNRQPRLARQWMRKHQRFQTDPVFKAFVQAADKQVAAEGYDMNDDEYYKVLDSRVKQRFPEEYKGQSRQEAPQRRRHPARGAEADESQGGRRRESGGFRRTNKGVMLSPSQLRNMVRFQMDPDDPKQREAYVRNNLSK